MFFLYSHHVNNHFSDKFYMFNAYAEAFIDIMKT